MDQDSRAPVPTDQLRPPAPRRPAAPAYEGMIDVATSAELSGWAVSSDGMGAPVAVTIAGREPIVASADRARPDVAAAGKSRGDGGWRIDVAALLQPGANVIEVRFPDGGPVPGSPVTVESGPPAIEDWVTYVGAIDLAEPPVLSGWSISSKFEPAPVTLEIGGLAPIRIEAEGARPDLAEQGLCDGRGGWSIDVGGLLRPGANHLRLRFPNGAELPGSPLRIDGGAGDAVADVAPEASSDLADVSPAHSDLTDAYESLSDPAAASGRDAGSVAATEPAPANTARIFPLPSSDATASPKPLSLAELDEISLDDLALAVERGMIDVPPPSPPPPVDEEAGAAPIVDTAPPVPRRSLLRWLLGRG